MHEIKSNKDTKMAQSYNFCSFFVLSWSYQLKIPFAGPEVRFCLGKLALMDVKPG